MDQFQAVDAEKELYPGANKEFQTDSTSSNIVTSKDIKEQFEEEQREAMEAKKEQERKDALQNLKTTLLVSGIVVAVAGAVIAITKKIRER